MRRAVSASAAPGAIKGFGRASSSRSFFVMVMPKKIPPDVYNCADKSLFESEWRNMAKRRDVLKGAVAAAVTGLSGFPGLVLGQSNPRTVKIGMIQPMTGIFAYNGE